MFRKLTTKVGHRQLRTPQSQGAVPVAPHPKPEAVCRDSGECRKSGNPLVKPPGEQKAPEARQKQQQIPPSPPINIFFMRIAKTPMLQIKDLPQRRLELGPTNWNKFPVNACA